MKINYLLPVLLSFVFACTNNEVSGPAYSDATQYYPIQEGWYMVYDLDTTIVEIDAETTTKSTGSQLMEKIGKPYDDGFGGELYPLERYKRLEEGMEWELDSIWSLVYRNNQYIRYENGIPYVVLVNPIHQYTQWDKNIYNDFEVPSSQSDTSYVSTAVSVGYPLAAGGVFYDKVANVREVNIGKTATNLSSIYQNVYYAQGLGKIKYEFIADATEYYVVTNRDDILEGNPYTKEVILEDGSSFDRWEQETLELGNKQLIQNAFLKTLMPDNVSRNYNPISMNNIEGEDVFEQYDNIEKWILEWQNKPNSPIFTYESFAPEDDPQQVTYYVYFYNPDNVNGFVGKKTTISEVLVEYGISVKQ